MIAPTYFIWSLVTALFVGTCSSPDSIFRVSTPHCLGLCVTSLKVVRARPWTSCVKSTIDFLLSKGVSAGERLHLVAHGPISAMGRCLEMLVLWLSVFLDVFWKLVFRNCSSLIRPILTCFYISCTLWLRNKPLHSKNITLFHLLFKPFWICTDVRGYWIHVKLYYDLSVNWSTNDSFQYDVNVRPWI